MDANFDYRDAIKRATSGPSASQNSILRINEKHNETILLFNTKANIGDSHQMRPESARYYIVEKKICFGANCDGSDNCEAPCVNEKQGRRFEVVIPETLSLEELQRYEHQKIKLQEKTNLVNLCILDNAAIDPIEGRFTPTGKYSNIENLCGKLPKRRCIPRCQVGKFELESGADGTSGN